MDDFLNVAFFSIHFLYIIKSYVLLLHMST